MAIPDFEKFDEKEFVKKIRQFMKKNQLSTREWAKETGSSASNLTRIENGETSLTIRLARHYQKFMREYLPGDGGLSEGSLEDDSSIGAGRGHR